MSSRPLHVAMVAPPWIEVPPPAYGGIEQLVADLVRELVAGGDEVTLIGAGPAGDSGATRYLATFPRTPTERLGEGMPEILHAAKVARLLDELDVDVVHDHSTAGPLTAGARSAPTVMTAHGPVDGEFGELYTALDGDVELVAISDAQRQLLPDANWTATVHNAIDVGSYPFKPDKQDYTLFLGRMNADKGVHVAIEAAREAGRHLVIAAKCDEDAEKEYFEAEVRPRLGPDVEYVGQPDGARKRELLREAHCLMLPLLWEEPFGLVMIEALACGTPVVALSRGSAPEVVVDGVTGIVCDEPDELPAALTAVDAIDPAACREDALRRFDLPVMARRYREVYLAAAAARRPVRQAIAAD